MPCQTTTGISPPVQELHLWNLHLDGLVTVQIHLPLLTATLALQLEPGIDVIVSANFVVAADPVIQHADTPNVPLVLENRWCIFQSSASDSPIQNHKYHQE